MVHLTVNSKRKKKVLFFLVVTIPFVFIAQAENWNVFSWQNSVYIKKAFFEIAYRNEYRPGLSKLKRWNSEIKYKVMYFKFSPPFEVGENLVDDQFKDLSDITAVSIVKSEEQPNFRIIFTRREYYGEAIQKYTKSKIKNIDTQSNCLAFFKHRRYQLVKATVIIPVDHAMTYGLLPACIVEELTQSMGLPNDSDWVNPSVANDESVSQLLTGLDYLMLKILYDKRLEIGMNIEQSSPIVDKILRDFEQQNLIQTAPLEVQKLRLYRQLE